MSDPKRHHFVPEMLLQRFVDARGRLYVFDRERPELGIRDPIPAEVLLQRHLYSTVDPNGAKRPDFERELGELETRAAPVIERLLAAARTARTPRLTSAERDIWDEFFSMQWRRVPDAQRLSPILADAESTVRDLLAVASSRYPHRADEIERLSSAHEVRRIARNARVDALRRPAGRVRAALASRGIAIVHIIPAQKSFIIGSFPVVKLTRPGRTDLRDHDVEMWLPIAPDVAVGVGTHAGTERYIPTVDQAHIRHLNEAIASQSRVIVGRSHTLIESIKHRLRPLAARPCP
jgi:hypothetical protein